MPSWGVQMGSNALQRAARYVEDCRGMIRKLDDAPAFVRSMAEAKEARALALESLAVIGELAGQLKQGADAPGGNDGNEK